MIPELQQLTKLNLTENQLKVIKNKYLKDSQPLNLGLELFATTLPLQIF